MGSEVACSSAGPWWMHLCCSKMASRNVVRSDKPVPAQQRQSMAADDGILETMGEPKRAAFPLPVRAEDAALRPVGEEGGREDRDMEERDGDVEEEEMEEEDEEDMLVGDEGVNYEEVAGAAGEAVGGTFEERMMLLLPVVMKGEATWTGTISSHTTQETVMGLPTTAITNFSESLLASVHPFACPEPSQPLMAEGGTESTCF